MTLTGLFKGGSHRTQQHDSCAGCSCETNSTQLGFDGSLSFYHQLWKGTVLHIYIWSNTGVYFTPTGSSFEKYEKIIKGQNKMWLTDTIYKKRYCSRERTKRNHWNSATVTNAVAAPLCFHALIWNSLLSLITFDWKHFNESIVQRAVMFLQFRRRQIKMELLWLAERHMVGQEQQRDLKQRWKLRTQPVQTLFNLTWKNGCFQGEGTSGSGKWGCQHRRYTYRRHSLFFLIPFLCRKDDCFGRLMISPPVFGNVKKWVSPTQNRNAPSVSNF